MDADIADILSAVSQAALPTRTLDAQALTRAWVNERTAPDLLPYPTELMERILAAVQAQIVRIEELSDTGDAKSNFTLVILQTELERVRFVVRSYLRARIAKIDKYPYHYRALALQQQHAQDSTDQPLLSRLEQQYLHSHQSLLSAHYHASFLSSFPAALQRLDDQAGGVSMVDVPDEDTAVFCRVLRDAGRVEVQGSEGVGEIELRRGDVWVLRWTAVRDGVRRGDVELI